MDQLQLMEGEQEREYLLRLGGIKEKGELRITWDDLAALLNSAFHAEHHYTESFWRKKYNRMIKEQQEQSFEKVMQHDERVSENRTARNEARAQDFSDRLIEAAQKVEPFECKRTPNEYADKKRAMIAMLSDIHYGLTFSGRIGSYNSHIAATRVMDYADELVNIGVEHDVHIINVVLMGDMISGIIHNTIRMENRENLVEQIIGASELVTAFLTELARWFEKVNVFSVAGNHSRVDQNTANVLRTERLDDLITWYAKGRLSKLDRVEFINSSMDSSVTHFVLFDKTYVCVHGDLDKDLHESVVRFEQAFDCSIDYILAGHLHVPDIRIEHTGFIRNGSVCGSGDDYTMRNRLFCPASQVALIATTKGVEAIYPIILTGE